MSFGRKQKILVTAVAVPFAVATAALFTGHADFSGWQSTTQWLITSIVLGGLAVPAAQEVGKAVASRSRDE